jgi:signal transduction histidine kinase/sugar lactone lactonase YvrE
LKAFPYIFIFLVAASSIFGQNNQELNFQNMDPLNLLPNNYVNDIAMDSLGFIWLATNGGLSRYDSPSNIKTYSKGDIGLESNLIKTIEVGKNGVIWIGTTLGGVTSYDINKNEYHTYTSDTTKLHTLCSSEILSIAEVDSSEIWVGSEGGIDVLYPEKDSVYNFNFFDKKSFDIRPGPVLDIHIDSKGWIWLTTWDGGNFLYIPNPSGKHSEGHFKQIIIPEFEGKSNVWRMVEYDSNHYWLATHNSGLGYMQLPEDATNTINNQDWEPRFKLFTANDADKTSIALNYVKDIEIDAEKNLWIGTNNGLSRLGRKEIQKLDFDIPNQKAEFSSYFQRASRDFTINDNNITSLFLGRQGLMWIGSSSGLNQYNRLTNRFNRIEFPKPHNAISIRQDRVNNIKQLDDNTLVIATNQNGLIGYDIESNTVLDNLSFSDHVMEQRAQTMFRDSANSLYIGARKGVIKIDTRPPYQSINLDLSQDIVNESYQNLNLNNNELLFYVSEIVKDTKNRLWVGSENDLYLVNENNKKWTTVIPNISVNKILEDSKGDIWIASYQGLKRIIGEGEEMQILTYQNGDEYLKNVMNNNQIITMKEYNQKIYFGYLNGFFVYNLKTNKFEIFDQNISNIAVNNLTITDKGMMWATSPNGLLHYDLEREKYNLYSQKDGLQMISFRRDSNFDGLDGKVYFGSEDGMIVIDESDWEHSNTDPIVYITSVKAINSDSKENLDIIGTQHIEIASDNISIEILFSSVNYSLPSENTYGYRLDGLEGEEWNYTSSQQALYTNLDPKTYTFMVKTANADGSWPEEYTSIEIKVLPKFVETNAFKLLMLALGILVMFLILGYYKKIANRRNNILKEYNRKLNNEVRKTEKAIISLAEREVDMQQLIQQLDESNKELTRSNEDLEQYAFITSHDLQEPLRTVGAFSGLLKEEIAQLDNPDLVTYVNFVEQGVERMSSLISSLLNYSLIGKDGDVFQTVDLNTLLEGKIQDLSIYLKSNNATVTINSMPEIYCRKEQIGTVFYNLILNGLKFNKSESPKVTVSSEELDDSWKFHVKDNGIGIAKDYQSKIFEIFKRLHKQTDYAGTGIGLALCNKIVISHKGKFSVESEEGKGSTFSFTISKHLNNPPNVPITQIEANTA